jgi:hypothetical protein
LLPAIDADHVRRALLDHVRGWSIWVSQMDTPGAQAYAVLTLCRALRRLQNGSQLSKRRAADQTTTVCPEWAGLIIWARDWWYSSGRDTDPGHAGDVRAFVNEFSAAILASERTSHTSPQADHIR